MKKNIGINLKGGVATALNPNRRHEFNGDGQPPVGKIIKQGIEKFDVAWGIAEKNGGNVSGVAGNYCVIVYETKKPTTKH